VSSPDRLRFAVDLGTTWTAAARADGVAVALGQRGAAMPSVVARDGDAFVVGTAAERVLATQPDRGVREIKRRFGDTTPIVLDGQPYTPDALTVELLRGAAQAAQVAPGSATVVLTHPANWGEYKLDLLRNVGAQAGFAEVELVSEPVAAARHYAAAGRLDVGDTVAVYDFGGGTFDAAVLRLGDDGPVLLGTPQGLERLGGIDIDQVVFSHVAASLGGALTALDRTDPDVRRAILALRAECTEAKEQLSADGEATINITAPGLSTQVRITRDELESALRPRIADTVQSLERAVAAAGLTMGDLAGIVLVGGSSRVPLVAEMVAAATGCTLLHDADMKSIVAAGAATQFTHAQVPTASSLAPAPVAQPAATAANPEPKEPTMSDATSTSSDPQAAPKPAGPPPPPPPTKKDDKGSISAAAVIGGTVAAAAAVAGGVIFGDDIVDAVTGGDDGADDAAAADAELAGVDGLAAPVDESMDVFDDVAVAPAAAPFNAPSSGGGGGGGNSGGGGGSGGGNSSGGGGGGGGQAESQGQAARPTPPPAPVAEAAPTPTPTPAPEPMPEPAIDADFEAARVTLLERIDNLDLGADVSAADVEAFKADLRGTVDRFVPNPGQTTNDALLNLRAQYDERVQDFTQDQKIEALIDEQLRDNEAETATDPTLDPAADPTLDPTLDPTADPTLDPTATEGESTEGDPAVDPVLVPNATEGETVVPEGEPTLDPTLPTTGVAAETLPMPEFQAAVLDPNVVLLLPETQVASDPDDGGEVTSVIDDPTGGRGIVATDFLQQTDALVDDFDAAVGTFAHDFGQISTDALGNGSELVKPVVDDVLGDSGGFEVIEPIPMPSVSVPDFTAVEAQVSDIGDAVADGDFGGAVEGILTAPAVFGEAIDDAVVLPFEPEIEEFKEDVSETVSDFVDDPMEAVNEFSDDGMDTVAGIADDAGL